MIQFKIRSGKKAGTNYMARRFPVRIGRNPESELQLEDDGVWDRHAQLDLDRSVGFVLSTRGDALTMVNGEPAQRAVLRNGDDVGLGAATMQFWLSDTTQRGLRFREVLTWIAIAAVSLCQVALIYWLIR